MNENLHEDDIDDLFRSALEGQEEQPGANVWQELEINLEKDKVIHPLRKYGVLKTVSVALLIMLFGFSFYELNSGNRKLENANLETVPEKDSFIIKEEKLPGAKQENRIFQQKLIGDSTALTLDDWNQLIKKHGKQEPVTEVEAAEDRSVAKNNLNEHTKTGPAKRSYQAGTENASAEEVPVQSIEPGDRTVLIERKRQLKQESKQRNDLLLKGSDKSDPLRADLQPFFFRVEKRIASASRTTGNFRLPAMGETLIRQPLVYVPDSFSAPALIRHIGANNYLKKASKNSPMAVAIHPWSTHRFSITGYVSKDANKNNLKSDRPAHREDDKDAIKQQETNSTSLGFGLLVSYQLPGNWSVETGPGYTTSGIDISPKVIYARRDNRGEVRFRYNCSSGYSFFQPKGGVSPTLGDSILVSRSKNMLGYLAVPLSVKYNFRSGKIAFSPELGLNVNLLVKQKIVTEISNGNSKEVETMKEIQGLKPSYISSVIGFKSSYLINHKLSLVVAPEARLALSAINKDAPVKTYRQSFGISAGIQMQF